MNGFWAIFHIFFLRPLFFWGEDGLRKAGGGKEGGRKSEDWTAADRNFGRHVSVRCCGTDEVHLWGCCGWGGCAGAIRE